MDCVFAIPELAEMILLGVDMTTLLVSVSRVSKAWNTLVRSSSAIQEALYFRPAISRNGISNAFAEPMMPWDETCATINPLLQQRFGHCFFDTGICYGYMLRANSFYSMPWTCDSRDTPLTAQPPDPRPLYARGPKVAKMTSQELKQVQLASRKLMRRDASWRRMLLTQPPAPYLGFLLMEQNEITSYGPHWAQTTLIDPTESDSLPGLRMGLLYDLVQRYAGHHERSSMWFRVVWNEAREPFNTISTEKKCREMLRSTNVVVEFCHESDQGFAEHQHEPADASQFDSIFRSEDCSQVIPQNVEKTWDGSEQPRWDREFSIV